MAKKCNKCGKRLKRDAKFCSYCGESIVEKDIIKTNIFSYFQLIPIIIIIVLAVVLFFVIHKNENILVDAPEESVNNSINEDFDALPNKSNNTVTANEEHSTNLYKEFNINGNTEGNRLNGGWVTEQDEWNYYSLSGYICKENIVTGEKYIIFDSKSRDANISLQVMGDWIYFDVGGSDLYRVSIDGKKGVKYTPQLGDDKICNWDVYNGNVYVVIKAHISASTYNYYFAITDWDTQSYQKLFDIGAMKIDDETVNPKDYYFADTDFHTFFYKQIGCNYFLGIDNGNAYFLYTEPISDFEYGSFQFTSINLDNLDEINQMYWINEKQCPYFSVCVSDNYLYALCYGTDSRQLQSDKYVEQNYYDKIDLQDHNITTYYTPLLRSNDDHVSFNISELGFLYSQPKLMLITETDEGQKVLWFEDHPRKICTAHNQIYYYSNKMYCRINKDGTGWQSIDIGDFSFNDSIFTFD